MIKVTLHRVSRAGRLVRKKDKDGNAIETRRVRKVWMLRWHDTTGRRLGETIENSEKMSKREANATRQERQVKLNDGVVPQDRPEKMTLEQFITYHENAIRGDVKPATLVCYRLALGHMKDVLGSDMVLRDVTVADAGRVKAARREAGRAATSIRSFIIALRCVFNRAEKWGLVTSNPFRELSMPRAQAKAKRIYQEHEIAAMVKVAPSPWWKAFIELLAGTGLRLAEGLHLQWSDLDFDKGMAKVTPKRAAPFTVTDRQYAILEWSPKSHEERTVPLPDEATRALKKLRKASDGSPYVFVSLERLAYLEERRSAGALNERYDAVNNVLRDFKVLQTRAREHIAKRRKIDVEKVKWPVGALHDLRKTYGTRMADHVPTHVLQGYMGHADISTTAKYYLAVGEHYADVVREAASRRKPRLRLAG